MRSLLARVRFLGENDARAQSASSIRDDILNQLRGMCVTRRGTMLTCPDYGLVDVSEMLHDFPDAIADMAKAIKHTIQNYEPRLTNVRVRHVRTETMLLLYEISAELQSDRGRETIQFQTSVEASRKVSVR
jgi:type VI secretion system protein